MKTASTKNFTAHSAAMTSVNYYYNAYEKYINSNFIFYFIIISSSKVLHSAERKKNIFYGLEIEMSIKKHENAVKTLLSFATLSQLAVNHEFYR